MKTAICPYFILKNGKETYCNLPLGRITQAPIRTWICSKHGIIGNDSVVNWVYEGLVWSQYTPVNTVNTSVYQKVL